MYASPEELITFYVQFIYLHVAINETQTLKFNALFNGDN